MKKLLCFGLLSLAALSSFAPESQAWGCCGRRHCCRYSTVLCIRPYNAFSPVAYGNICADGCMPINIYGGQMPCMQQSCFAPQGFGGCCSPFGGCSTSGCCENGCLPAPGSYAGAPMTVTPGQPMPAGQPGPSFTPPNPQPIGQTNYYQAPYGYAPVQPVGYAAPTYPQSPVYNYGYGYQVPSYWYGH